MTRNRRNLVYAAAALAISASAAFAGGTDVQACNGDSTHNNCSHSGGIIQNWVSFGASAVNVNRFNDTTRKLDYSRSRDFSYEFGFGATHRVHRYVGEIGIIGNWWSQDRRGSNHEQRLTLSAATLQYHVGFNLLKSQSVALFPYAGMDLGMFNLAVSHDTAFSALPISGQGTARIHRMIDAADVGLGFELGPVAGKCPFSVGARAGYTFDLARHRDWTVGGMGVEGLPALHYTGPYARIVLGKTFGGHHKS